MLADSEGARFTEVFATAFSRARLASFEGATAEDRQALHESWCYVPDHFWTQQRSVADLFLTTRFMENATVADCWGCRRWARVSWRRTCPHSGARGIMSHPGIIAGMGDREIGSFVNRGKYLMERLLCKNPIAVPAEIFSQIEAFNADTTGLNEHERAAIRMTRPVCWGCHSQFEPMAFGFARFDAAGRYVGAIDVAGKPLPLEGWVPTGASLEPEYADMRAQQVLATTSGVQYCLTDTSRCHGSQRANRSRGPSRTRGEQ